MTKNVIYAVGLDPGANDLLTPRALETIKRCDTVAGYSTYLKQFPELFADNNIISSGMCGEVERCEEALDAAVKGAKVAWSGKSRGNRA